MSYAKQKGTKYESDTVKYLTELGFTTARRVPLSGAAGDRGDIWLGENPTVPTMVLECKSYAKELSYGLIEDFIQEAHTEYHNATGKKPIFEHIGYALLFVKRPNLGVADSWLIWKNKYGVTLRARLGDVLNANTMDNIETEEERITKLQNILKGV